MQFIFATKPHAALASLAAFENIQTEDSLDRLDRKDREDLKQDFTALVADCQMLRRCRNDLLHSAFVELRAGGDVVGILRSNPKIKIDQSW